MNDTATTPPRFLAVGQDGLRLVSADGLKWDTPQLGKEGQVYRAACFGNGRFAAVGTFGGRNIFAATAGGRAWQTSDKDGHYKIKLMGLCFGDGRFVALGGEPGSVGNASPVLMHSRDGVAWGDYLPLPRGQILRRVAYGDGRFVGVGDRGRRSVSRDARVWQDAPKTRAIDTLADVAYGHGVFIGVGLHGLRMVTEDGLKWGQPLRGEEGEHLNSVVWTGDRFVAAGPQVSYFSPDGATWERAPTVDGPLTMTYGDGLFVGTRWKGRLLVSRDAVHWQQVYKGAHHVEAVAHAGS